MPRAARPPTASDFARWQVAGWHIAATLAHIVATEHRHPHHMRTYRKAWGRLTLRQRARARVEDWTARHVITTARRMEEQAAQALAVRDLGTPEPSLIRCANALRQRAERLLLVGAHMPDAWKAGVRAALYGDIPPGIRPSRTPRGSGAHSAAPHMSPGARP